MNKINFTLFLLIFSACFFILRAEIKQFELYDAITYPGKPDLTSERLLPVFLIYEGSLTKPDPQSPDKVILDMDKVRMEAELAAEFPDVMVSTDIETWFSDVNVDEYEMLLRFKTLFDEFRAKTPNVVIGNYGIAPSALCVYRYYYKDKYTDGVIIQNWKNNNAKRWRSLGEADVAMPVAYIAEPNIDSWIRDLGITVQKIKEHTDKKIYMYIWPQYYDKPDSPYFKEIVAPDIWREMLEAVYEKCDGAIIWSSRTDKNNNILYWNDSRIQSIWNETKNFIEAHEANIKLPETVSYDFELDNPNKSFKMFSSISYSGTPGLSSYGFQPINIVKENDISSGLDANGIYVPDLQKVESLAIAADNRNIPVMIDAATWIRDRVTDSTAMKSRYEQVSQVFKNNSPNTPLGFTLIGPTGLSGLKVSNSNFFVDLTGWLQTAVVPTRSLRQYADYLLPVSFIIDDDTLAWKKEFYLTIKEAKRNNPGKPIYAYIHTDYFNNNSNFSESYKPIKEVTFAAMLEAIFNTCDGVVMNSIGSSVWSEEHGFWIAVKKFVEKHKNNIDFPKQWSVDGNILQNGSFEDPIIPSAIETTFGVNYSAPLNNLGFFDALSRTTNPNIPEALNVPDYVWFERGTTQHQCRFNVYTTIAHSGTNSMAIHNVGGSTSNATAGNNGWYYQNLAQRVSLDDTKIYELSFYAKRPFTYRNTDNLVNDLYVGIVSSTGAVPQTNQTYFKKVTLPDNEDWNEFSVILDLPAIIEANPDKSFEKCAVFIAMQTGWDEVNMQTLQSLIYVDDVSLVDKTLNGLTQQTLSDDLRSRIKVIKHNVKIDGEYGIIKVYDISGKLLIQRINLDNALGFDFCLFQPGVYILEVDSVKTKLLIL